MTPGAHDAVAAGTAAWARITEHGRKCWGDWLDVARALVIGRTEALKAAGTNRAVGTRYNRAMGEWLRDNGLDGINNQERYRALLVLEKLPAIEAWREALDETQRRRFNHPNAVWFAWRRATKTDTKHRQLVVLSAKATAQKCGYGRAIHWPQDTLQRAANAIRETRSNDCITLAKAALQAAVRNESDLLALLPAASATPQRSADRAAHADV
jgi:hypothetical protein